MCIFFFRCSLDSLRPHSRFRFGNRAMLSASFHCYEAGICPVSLQIQANRILWQVNACIVSASSRWRCFYRTQVVKTFNVQLTDRASSLPCSPSLSNVHSIEKTFQGCEVWKTVPDVHPDKVKPMCDWLRKKGLQPTNVSAAYHALSASVARNCDHDPGLAQVRTPLLDPCMTGFEGSSAAPRSPPRY